MGYGGGINGVDTLKDIKKWDPVSRGPNSELEILDLGAAYSLFVSPDLVPTPLW